MRQYPLRELAHPAALFTYYTTNQGLKCLPADSSGIPKYTSGACDDRMVVFLRTGICIRLLSDSASQWTPLPFAKGWARPTPVKDLHHQVCKYARHTKTRLSGNGAAF
ncbi:MAG: hypothetical protein QM654_08405 [Dysgonamonadaceae bacterium]